MCTIAPFRQPPPPPSLPAPIRRLLADKLTGVRRTGGEKAAPETAQAPALAVRISNMRRERVARMGGAFLGPIYFRRPPLGRRASGRLSGGPLDQLQARPGPARVPPAQSGAPADEAHLAARPPPHPSRPMEGVTTNSRAEAAPCRPASGLTMFGEPVCALPPACRGLMAKLSERPAWLFRWDASTPRDAGSKAQDWTCNLL